MKERESNMECIRIIAMSMIVIWHFFIHGGGFDNFPVSKFYAPLMISGVDLFILVSGYFMIKFRWSSILRLAVLLFVFQFVSMLLKFGVTGEFIPSDCVVSMCIAPVTRSPYWFICLYAALMVLSPVLNMGLSNLDIPKLRLAMILLSIVEFYSCWTLKSIDPKGNGLFTFLYLYILGCYLSREPFFKSLASLKIALVGLTALILNMALNFMWLKGGLSNALFFHSDFAYSYPLKYSNPLIVVFSASLLLWMQKHPFSSRAVNSIAGAALGVYLLQEGFYGLCLYGTQYSMCSSAMDFFLSSFLLFVGYWVVSWLLMLVVKPLSALCTRVLKRHLPKRLLFTFGQNPNTGV